MNKEDIKEIVEGNKIVVFAKGTLFQPMCGFSANAFHWLNQLGKPFTVVNIFDDESIRPAYELMRSGAMPNRRASSVKLSTAFWAMESPAP